MTLGRGCAFLLPMPAPLTWDSDPSLQWDTIGASWNGVVAQPITNTKMAQQDLAKIRATQAWITQLNTLLQAVVDHLAPKAIPLTVEQRRKNPGIGLENESMVNKGVAIIRDNAAWFPGLYDRAELLLDVEDRALLLLSKSLMLNVAEMYDDTLQAVESDIVRAVLAGKPYIEQSADLTGMNNNLVAEFLDWFQRFANNGGTTPPPTPPTP